MGKNLSFSCMSLLILVTCLLIACGGPQPADLVLHNGKVITMDEEIPEAEALAVRSDRIVAVGSDDEILDYVGSDTKVIDLDGKLAIPGFIEGHGHFTGIGRGKLQLDLMNVRNWDEIVAMVADRVQEVEPGEWITGRGWHQEKWDKTPQPDVDGLPTHQSLSAVSPDNPVILTHASGHASFANAKAMEMAGITASTKPPAGGEIVTDRRGNPIGMFRETAQGLLRRARSDEEDTVDRQAQFRRIVELATDECLSKGITSFQDAGSSYATVDGLKALVDEGALRLRLWVMLRESNSALAERMNDYRIIGYGDNRLTVRAIKRSIDGALGSHGAWLLEPYSDMPSSSGLNTTPVESIRETARLAAENDFQLCIHAIGDRANREVLDIFEEAFAAHPDKSDFRWRDEHTQHLHPDDIPRFAQLGVIASMQAIHATSDGPWVVERLGEERAEEGAYVWRKLIDSGAVVTNGTDAPVEDVSPIASFYASVSRKTWAGTYFYPEQKMTRQEALRSYTLDAAYAAFEEDLKGSLSVGKLADIVILSKDIMTIPEDEIPSTEVVQTIVGGQVKWPRSN